MYKYVYALIAAVAHREMRDEKKIWTCIEKRITDECYTDPKTFPGMCASL
jgi:hypothetical protein